jgi:hypothetical protein
MRLRVFRNLLTIGTLVFILIALSLGYIGWQWKTAIPLCFTPQAPNDTYTLVCPQGEQPVATETNLEGPIASTVRRGDLLLVELLGLLGAALSGAAAVRKLKGSSMPYGVPVTVACFKLPHRCPDRGGRPAAHARRLHPRPQRARHLRADSWLGSGFWSRSATGHSIRRQPRRRAP